MASRFIVTGVQLGMLKAALETLDSKALDVAAELLKEIEDEQFIGNSNNDIAHDVDEMAAELDWTSTEW